MLLPHSPYRVTIQLQDTTARDAPPYALLHHIIRSFYMEGKDRAAVVSSIVIRPVTIILVVMAAEGMDQVSYNARTTDCGHTSSCNLLPR